MFVRYMSAVGMVDRAPAHVYPEPRVLMYHADGVEWIEDGTIISGIWQTDALALTFLLPVCCIVACCSALPSCYRSGPQPVDTSGAGEDTPHRSSGQRISSS